MYIFKSEQVIKNCDSDFKITSLIFKSPDLNRLDYRVWGATVDTCQNRPTLPNWRLPCCRNGMICHGRSLTRQFC